MELPLQIMESYFTAFAERDFNKMKLLYHQDISYFDPLCGYLNGDQVISMLEEIYGCLNDFRLEQTGIRDKGDGYFIIDFIVFYTSLKSGNKIALKIKAYLKMDNQKITEQSHGYSLHDLFKQEFGFVGWLLGWNRLYQNRIKIQTRKKILNSIIPL